jgi:hypothetical protein
MKKLLALSLILIMLLCSCSAPKKKENNDTGGKNDTVEDVKKPLTYTIYAGGGYDNLLVDDASGDGPKFESLPSLELGNFSSSNSYINKDIPAERKFTIGDLEYSLKYRESFTSVYSGKTNDLVKDFGAYDLYTNERVTTLIKIRPQTNVVDSFLDADVDIKLDGDFTEDQALEMATALFKEIYGENVFKEYSLTNLYTANGQYDKSITVIFRRMIHGYATSDTVRFSMNQKGELQCIWAPNIFLFKDAENEVSKADIQAAEKVLRDSVSEDWDLYGGVALFKGTDGRIYICIVGRNDKLSGENYEQSFYINVN